MTTPNAILNYSSLANRGAAYLAGTSRSVRRGRAERPPSYRDNRLRSYEAQNVIDGGNTRFGFYV
jgi:hypothetical protein